MLPPCPLHGPNSPPTLSRPEYDGAGHNSNLDVLEHNCKNDPDRLSKVLLLDDDQEVAQRQNGAGEKWDIESGTPWWAVQDSDSD